MSAPVEVHARTECASCGSDGVKGGLTLREDPSDAGNKKWWCRACLPPDPRAPAAIAKREARTGKKAPKLGTPEAQAALEVEAPPARPRGVQSGLGSFLPVASRSAPPDHGRAVLVDVDLVDENAEMAKIRVDEETVAALVESIPELGLIQPVTLTPKGDRYELQDGRHRTLAYKRLLETTKDTDAWGKIPALIRTDIDERTKKAVAGTANSVRRIAGEYEQALHYKALQDAGDTVATIARKAGVRSEQTIRNRLRLLKLPADIGQLIGPGHWFGSSHAEVVIPALEKWPKKAADALRTTIARVEEDRLGKEKHPDVWVQLWPLTVERFRDAFAEELNELELLCGVGTYQEQDVRRSHPELGAMFDKVPKITLGQMKAARDYYSDWSAVARIVKEAEKRDRAKEKERAKAPKTSAKSSSSGGVKAAETRQANEKRVRALEEQARVAAVLGVQERDRARILSVAIADWLVELRVDDKDARAALCAGLKVEDRDLVKLTTGRTAVELVEKMLKAKDQTPLARLVAAAFIFRGDYMRGESMIEEDLVKLDVPAWEEQARRENKTGKKEPGPLATRPAPAPAARPAKKGEPNRAGVAAAMQNLRAKKGAK